MKQTTTLFIALLLATVANAQNGFPCATDFLHQQALQNLVFFKKHQAVEQEALDFFTNRAQSAAERGSQVVTVPVVVHIIHDNGPENIPDAQVQQAIQWLNESFANVGYYDQGSGAEVGIQFCLAQRTPDGQPTNGITRDQSPLTDLYIEGNEGTMKNINRWAPKEYINIWVVRDICSAVYGCGVVAYAYYPSFHGSSLDGIVIEAGIFGTSASSGAGLAHELGHYFGLYHTFEGGCSNGNCLVNGDRVCDTPPDQSTAAVPCDQPANTCSTDTLSGFATDQPDMNQNFLDYGNLNCMHDFTPGQAARMNFYLSGTRKSLLSSKGCLPPCPLPVLAAFTPGDTTILAGQTLLFDNNSQNAINFSWSINGAPFGGQQNAAYLFDSTGIFTIKLVAQPLNGQLCEADSAQVVVQVTCPVVADFGVSNLSPEEGQTIFLTNNSQNANQFEWFVNGVSQGAVLDSVVFTESGSYEIRLVAVGSFCSSSATQTVQVRDSCTSKTWILRYSFGGSINGFLGSYQRQTVLTDGSLLAAYVINQATSSTDNVRVFFIKAKTDGSIFWSKLVGNMGAAAAYCLALIGSPDGGFVAVMDQFVFSNSKYHAYISKFSPDGAIEWMRLLNDNLDIPSPYKDIFINSAGEIVIDEKIKFDLNGNLVWSKMHSGLDVDKTAVMLDGSFVTVGRSNAYLFHLARFDSNGDVVWAQEFATDNIQALDVAIAPDGDILVLGLRPTPSLLMPHTVLLKFTPEGNLVWARRYFHKEGYRFYPTSFALDENGIVVIAHSNIKVTLTSVGDARAMLRVGYDGNVVWVRHFFDYYFSDAQLSTLNDGFFGISQDTWLKTDPLGFAGECQNEPRDVSSQDLAVTPSSLAVNTLSSPTDFPLTSLPIVETEIQSDTLCAPACPRGIELCNNNLDDDEDGLFDCLDPDCDCAENVCAPGEANIWYFGNQAGLDFSTEPPTVLTDGALVTPRAAAVACDKIGNLLFYSNGDRIFNRFHEPMPNGALMNTFPNPECIAVPHPGDNALYYLFTTRPTIGGLYYSLIDMRLDEGRGDVVPNQKAIGILDNDPTLTAVQICYSGKYWLLAHGYSDNMFYAYEIDENGLNTNPIISPGGGDYSTNGQMKFSPQGNRIARCISGVLGLYDFDATTGLVNNPIYLTLPTYYHSYGLEFSPNQRYLYITIANPSENKIFQVNLEELGSSQTLASSTEIVTIQLSSPVTTRLGALQLAPNGKIYITNGFGPVHPFYPNFHVIHQPNLSASACQFQINGQSLSPTPGASYGLVNVVQSIFAQPTVAIHPAAPDTICVLDSLYTYGIEKSGCFKTDSTKWTMEGLSGTLYPEFYIGWIKFDAPGEGQLIYTIYTECGIVSDTLHIVVAEPFDKTLDLGPDQTVCDNGVFTLNAGSGFARYRWQNGAPDSVLTTLLPGKYWVDVWDACSNQQSDTVTVSIAPATVLALGDDRMGCPDLTAVFQRPDFFSRWRWSPADFISCDTCASVTVSPAATTSWIVVAQTDDGCISVDTVMFQIQDTLFFELDTNVCVGQTIDLFGVAFPADTTAQFFFSAPGLGCDTLLTINILGLDAPFLEIEKTICAGAFFTYNGIALTADTTAVFLQPGVGGECDSVVTVTVQSWPPLTVTLPPDTTLRVGATLILNAETNGAGMLDFQWSPAAGLSCTNCSAPETSPLETTLFTLTVADANGCRAQDSVLVTVDPACFVIIPNAFTPNGDGINDFFYPKTDPCVRRVRVWRVASRWGEMVFERQNFEPSNPNLGWDGNRKNGEPFPSDVLAWYAELEYYDGRVEVRKGDVALLR